MVTRSKSENLSAPSSRSANRTTKIIGTPTQRLEGPEKVSGRAIYATDMCLPGMLWCKVLRSPISYGRIKQIDASRALALSGVHAVATGADVAGLLIGRKIYDMPILADGVVRFIGEKVAAVAAESEAIAEAAVELIDVEYEEMPALLDPLEAVKLSAALLHPNVAQYRGLLAEQEARLKAQVAELDNEQAAALAVERRLELGRRYRRTES